MKFTEVSVKAFVIPEGKSDHYEWDASMPGFGFRCRRVGGSKVYLVKYRVGNKQRKVTLGATNKGYQQGISGNGADECPCDFRQSRNEGRPGQRNR